jgi:hypothetical protein
VDGSRADIPYKDEREDDQQQGVEDAEQLAIERVAPSHG